MIRTLIVDDDSLIHVTLRSMIDWEGCGYTVAQDCGSGSQALRYLQEHSADLLITDIRMPGMSGLELMRQLRERAALPVTVVLSGYDEFDLVREAFRLGAYDYLLKANITPSGVTEMLTSLREKVFRAAVVNQPADRAPELTPGDYVTALFVVENFTQAAQRFGDNLRIRMEKPMLELARQIRRLQDRMVLRARTPSCYELYYRVRDPAGAVETVYSVVRQIQGLWHDFMNLDTAAGISTVVPLGKTDQAVEQCGILCKLAVLRGPGEICGQWEYGALAAVYEQEASAADGLITALCGDDADIFAEETGRYFSSLKQTGDLEHVQKILILLARLGERLERYGLSLTRVFPERPDFPRILEDFQSRREREIWLRNTLRRVHEVCGSQRKDTQKGAVQLAKEFMQDNFTNPELMLKTVADYVGFSEKYFSARFTKECGSTFINYLNDLRIRRAKELLLQTDMRIYEISDAVGYSSVEHFHHMFKKKLGISPKDFRANGK